MKIIAFGHKARVGKDTAAKYLVSYLRTANKNHSFKDIRHCSFAYELKQRCYDLFGWAGLHSPEHYEAYPDQKEQILWKIGKSPREIWIEFGNHMRSIYPDIWIDLVFNTNIDADLLIISDLRYPNEANRIIAENGHCIRIDKHDAPIRTDVADTALVGFGGWDLVINNDGTLNKFYKDITDKVSNFLWR